MIKKRPYFEKRTTLFEGTENVKEIRYLDSDGRLHRDDDKPALVEYHSNTNVKFRAWYKHGVMHRARGYAWALFDSCGKPSVGLKVQNDRIL